MECIIHVAKQQILSRNTKILILISKLAQKNEVYLIKGKDSSKKEFTYTEKSSDVLLNLLACYFKI